MLTLESSSTIAEPPYGVEGLPPRVGKAHRPEPTQNLLARYAQTGTSECFEEIVRRYGAMVLAVCQGVTHNRHDAEDATQTTFFVLAERLRAGETIRSLGSWLQQVARRAALDIRRSGARRQRREQNRAINEVAPDCVADQGDADQMAAVVREELDRVPAKYRIPLVLHYFGGLDFAEAARELGLKPATLGVRLFRGRKLLGERLARRGVALSAPALAACLARVIRASLTHAFQQSATRIACTAGMRPLAAAPVAGHAVLSGLVSSKVKMLVAAALVVAASAGARAAVHHLPDLPSLLDLGRLRPRLPSIRSSLPPLRVDAAPTPMNDHAGTAKIAAAKPAPISIDGSQPAVTWARPTDAAGSSAGGPAGGGNIASTSTTSARPTSPAAGQAAIGPKAPALGQVAVSAPGPRRSSASAAPNAGAPAKPEADNALAAVPMPARGVMLVPSKTPIGSAPYGALASATPPTGATFLAGATSAGGSDLSGYSLTKITTQNTAASGTTVTFSATGTLASASGGAAAAAMPPGSPVAMPPGSTVSIPPSAPAPMPVGSPYSGIISITSGQNSYELSFLNTNDPSIPKMPGGKIFLGVWALTPNQVLAGLPLTLSLNPRVLSGSGADPSQLTLWAYNGKWSPVSSLGSADSATINNPTNIQFFAVGTPEPTGAAVGAVVGLLLLMRRRRHTPVQITSMLKNRAMRKLADE